MILFKLLLIPMFLITIFIIIKVGMFFYKLTDDMEVNEKKSEIEHKSELVDEVEDFVNNNDDKIKKATSNIVDEFVKK